MSISTCIYSCKPGPGQCPAGGPGGTAHTRRGDPEVTFRVTRHKRLDCYFLTAKNGGWIWGVFGSPYRVHFWGSPSDLVVMLLRDLWERLRGRLPLALTLLLMGCGGSPAVYDGVQELDDGLRDVAQGCDWRAAGRVAYEPRDPSACYEVFAWLGSRLTTEPLADPCDAPELPSPVLYRPGEELWGYYDRSELETAKVLRNERLDACP